MHTPTPDPREDEEEPDVKTPPVPPDQEPEVVPQREPPNPAQHPLIAYFGRVLHSAPWQAYREGRALFRRGLDIDRSAMCYGNLTRDV